MEIKATEQWCHIHGTVYEISNFGNLRNTKTMRMKTASRERDRYLYHCMRINGKDKAHRAHRLVAKYFLPNYSEDLQVNHKDFNRENNFVDNLEMLTLAENIKYSARQGRYKKFGESNNNCKVDDIKILTIKTCAYKFTDLAIGKALGLPRKYVNDVKLGKIRAN